MKALNLDSNIRKYQHSAIILKDLGFLELVSHALIAHLQPNSRILILHRQQQIPPSVVLS